MAKKQVGMEIDLGAAGNIREDYLLFSETPGYVLEVAPGDAGKLKAVYKKYGVQLIPLGMTTKGGVFKGSVKGKGLFDICLCELKKSWLAK